MKGTRAAARYAKAFIDLTVEKGMLEQAYADMVMLVDICNENQEFTVFLKSPLIKTDKKQEVIKALFDGKVDAITSSYLNLITAKKREIFLVEIAEEFIRQYKANKNILTAVVTSATAIDDAIRAAIVKSVKSEGVTAVELQEVINKELIGGLIVRIGDKQVDASIARKLSDLRQSFSESSISN